MKKILSTILAATLAFGTVNFPAYANTGKAKYKSVTDYTYTITPLLAPFNEYFFVKTNNPDPTSFRFADKSSVYDKDSCISLDWDDWDNKISLYSDIKYENKKTGRVNGGYIFKSYDTDGGEIVLQTKKNNSDYAWDVSWSDTKVKLKLPALTDDVDYLIDKYATKSDFFDNMDAVQQGFSSICLYSGSYIRGTLQKTSDYWSVSPSGHKDQSFYIFSPYDRNNSKSLFASVIYPFRYDSWGFPSIMGKVSQRLDSSSSYEWDSYFHYLIDVSYGGKTKSYGGAGKGEGKGISEDKIKQYFSFGTNGTKITLDSARKLLDDYAVIEMKDDIPRKDALTWKNIYNTVGDGAWARLSGGNAITNGKWDPTNFTYAYFYQNGDGTYFSSDEWGVGYEIYWGGDLGYASDTWVDGRYVNLWECFEPGEKFEDHPTSDILLRNVTIPQITYDINYKYNDSTENYDCEYTNFKITEKQKTVSFSYSEDENIWIASYDAFDDDCANYRKIADLVKEGLIDKKYLDMVTLTLNEVKALKVDRNTNKVPGEYYIYDGTTVPGATLKNHKHNYTSEIKKQPTCTATGTKTNICLVCGKTETQTMPKIAHKYVKVKVNPTLKKTGYTAEKCTKCGALKNKKTIAKLKNITKAKIKGITAKSCTGKQVKQKIKVVIGKKVLKNGRDYTLKYGKNKSVGKGTVTIIGKGKYGGKITKSFKILPAKTSVKLSTTKGKIKVTLKKSKGAKKYQIQYATNRKFKSAKKITTTSIKKSFKAKSKKVYYARVRSVNGKYVSGWSAVKKIKVK